MLILAKITSGAAAGYAKYLEGKSKPSALGDYYLKDGERVEAPGRWARGAEQFGLNPRRPVTGEQLHALMAVRRPDTGAELRRAGGSGEAVAAVDATFSAPKSVSAVWALADPELRARIEAAQEAAIDRALDYAVAQVPMLRRRVSQDAVVHEKAAGLVATSWRHSTARAVEGQVPDPQLHSHVLLHGAVRRDGQVAAIDSRSWLVHQREVGAAYRTELARELGALGFAVRRGTGRGERYFELDGVPQPLLDRWSSRHRQVQAAIRDRLRDLQGRLSPKQERMMGTVTRSAKVGVSVADLDAAWRETAGSFQLGRKRVDALRGRAHGPLEPIPARGVLEGLTEFDATFPAREARAVALEQSAGAPIEGALEQLRELRARDEILVLADGAGTTRRHRGRERTVVAIAGRLADARIPALPAGVAEREVERLDRALQADRGRLSAEQRSAIRLACGPRPLVVIEGQAGTGKSTTLTAIARAHQASGRQIIVTSTAALAAARLATELGEQGVRCRAYSTAALEAAVAEDRLALSPATTIVHDEAALASTREQLAVLDAVEHSGARLIMVGDAQQNQPVGAGGLWANIQDATRAAEARAELTLNVRARNAADRRNQALFRHGQAEGAIRGYASRSRVHFDDDPRRLEDRALDAAHADRTAGKTTIVIAQTSNDQLDALNASAQAIRHQAGQLGDQSLPVPGRPYRLRAGDHVQIRRTIWRDNFGPLRNGTPARVAGVERDGEALSLSLARGDAVSLTAEQAADADLRLAYAQHPFPAQGRTTDTTHLIVGEHATREGSYVGLTRARARTDVYAVEGADAPPERDRLGDLAERMSRTEPDLPSIRVPLAHEAAITAGATRGEVAEPDTDAVLQPGPDPSDDRGLDLDRNGRSARSWPGTRSDEPLTLVDEAERKRERSLGLEP